MASSDFYFKNFAIRQTGVVHPVGTDSVLLGAWCPVNTACRALDIGTGTGILALMLAQRRPELMVDAVELDAHTAECARRNVAASPFSHQISVFQTSIQYFEPPGDPLYDLVVSNPPFFSETTVAPDLRRRLGRHQATLRPGALVDAVVRWLAPGGVCCVILPTLQAGHFREIATLKRLYPTRECTVYSKPGKPPERILMQLERTPGRFQREEPLFIYASDEEMYSEAFTRLTKDFYR